MDKNDRQKWWIYNQDDFTGDNLFYQNMEDNLNQSFDNYDLDDDMSYDFDEVYEKGDDDIVDEEDEIKDLDGDEKIFDEEILESRLDEDFEDDDI